MVDFFHSNGIFIYKKCVGVMKKSKIIIIVFFGLVFQNCKTKKLAFNKTENNINNYISYDNSLNYNSNTYNISNKTEIASDSSNKPSQVQLESSLKRLSGFCAVVGVITNDKQTGQWVVGLGLAETNNGLKEVVTYQKENERIKTGPIKTIRKGFVIIATLLLITAILLLFFALLKWQSIYLLWSSISAGISYVLFKLGKKRFKTDWVEADRKQLKKLKKSAFLVGLISGFIYLITLVF
jgi:hypothetical protein